MAEFKLVSEQAYMFKLASLEIEISGGAKKKLGLLRTPDFLEKMVDCLITIVWTQGPNKGKRGKLLLSHGCKWPQDLLEKADWVDGCHTPKEALKYQHKMVLLPHPNDPTTVHWLDNKNRHILYGEDCREYAPLEFAIYNPENILQTPKEFTVTQNDYSSGLWKAQMIREQSFNPLQLVEDITGSHWEVTFQEGNGFMFPEELPYKFKHGPVFGMEKKTITVYRDISEYGWGVAVNLPN